MAPRDVSRLEAALEVVPPGTMIPAGELLEQLRSLPAVNGGAPDIDEEPDSLLTADAVAKRLTMDRQSIYRLARENKLPSVRIGPNTVRFKPADVEQWILDHTA